MWAQAGAAALFVLVVLVVPGYLVLRGLGVLRLQAVAAAPAVGSAFLGLLVVVYHHISVPWNLMTASLGVAVVLAAMLALLRLVQRRWPASRPDSPVGVWWPLVAALTLACLLSAQAVLRGTGGIDAPLQASDGVWHLNAAAYTRALEDAYPVGSLAPMYWGDTNYYPSGWHALVAVMPAPVPVSANVLALLGAAVLWPVGCTSLLAASFPLRSRQARDALPLLAGTIASATATAPFVMATTLWPYAWSVCLLPGVITLLLVSRPLQGPAPRRVGPWLPGTLAALALAMVGMVFIHGASVFNMALLGGPALLLVVLHEARRLWRQGGRSRLGLLAAVAAMLLVIALGALVFADQLRMLANFSRPGSFVSETLLEAWHDAPMIARIPDSGLGATGLSLLAVLGMVVSLVRRRHRWAALCVPLLVALLVASVMTDSPVSVLASPWYMQKSRILPLLEIVVLVLAVTFVEWLVVLAASRTGRQRIVASVLAAVCSVTLVVNAVGRAGLHERVVAGGYQPEHLNWEAMLAPGEVDFIRDSAAKLPSGAVVLGQPTNGSAYYWSLTGTEVVFPTLRDYTEEDRLYVAANAAYILVDPEVCHALDRLGAHYYYTDADPREGGALGGGKAPQWYNQLNLIPDEALTPVATDGVHTLWLLSSCGWDS